MRTREKIEGDFVKLIRTKEWYFLEVLLDIRDLLSKDK